MAPFRYITAWDDRGGGWLLLVGGPFSLLPGPRLADLEAERGIIEDVYCACPGTDRIRRVNYSHRRVICSIRPCCLMCSALNKRS